MSGFPPLPDEPGRPPSRAGTSGSDPVVLPSDPSGTIARDPSGVARSGAMSIGPYQLLQKLGEGGMGAVYLAADPKLNRKVAIKTMRHEVAQDKGACARFLREAGAAAAVEHDNIVPILHIGEASDGSPFIAMPFLRGEPLDARLAREPVLPLALLLKVGRETAAGLAAAHAAGLIHRDIKPANVWLEGDPKAAEPALQVSRCKILDFGLARSVDKDDAQITASGAILGTPSYMAPEQARGDVVDRRADLFSLGVMLYRMATGKPPFAGTTAMAVLIAVTTDTPRPVRELAPNLPAALARLIERLMCKDPDGRPRSAAEVAEAIRQIEAGQAQALDLPEEPNDELTEEEVEPAPKRGGQKRKSRRGLLVGAALLFAVLAVVGVVVFALAQRGRGDKGTGTEQVAAPTPQPPVSDPNAANKPAPNTPPGPSKTDPPKANPPKVNPPKGDPTLPKPQPAGPVEVPEPGKKAALVPLVWPPKEQVAALGDERFRHWSRVDALAASPDGKWVVTVTSSATASSGYPRYVLHLWDAATGKEIATAEDEHYGMGVAFAPDSRRLAVMAGGTSLILWDSAGGVLKKGDTLKVFAPAGERVRPGSTEHFKRVSFAPGGKALVAWGTQCTVWTWALNDGTATPDTVTAPPVLYLKTFTVSADGTTMAWAQELATTRKTRLWVRRLGEGAAVELGDSVEPVMSVALSSDGRALAAVVGETTRVWDLGGAAPRVQASLPVPKVPPSKSFHVWGFSPDGRHLVCGHHGTSERTVWLADLRDEKPALVVVPGAVVTDPQGHGAGLVWLGAGFVGCGPDHALRVWVPKGNTFEPRDDWYAGHAGPVRALAYNADGSALVAVSRQADAPEQVPAPSALTVWHLKPAARPVTALLKQGWFNEAAFLPDGTVLACGAEQDAGKASYERRGFLRRFDPQTVTGTETVWFMSEVMTLDPSSDGQSVAVFAGPKYERTAQLVRGAPLKVQGAPIKAQGLQAVAMSPDGRTVAVACKVQGRDDVVRLWDADGAAAPRERPEPLKFGKDVKLQGLAFSPDNKSLATLAGGLLYVWDLASGRERTTTRDNTYARLNAVAWSRDGRFIATATSDARVIVYRSDTLEKVREWRFPGLVHALAFDRAGTRLATGNGNGSVCVLDVEAILNGAK